MGPHYKKDYSHCVSSLHKYSLYKIIDGPDGVIHSMAIRVVEFSNGVYKIRKIFAKKSIYQKKLLNFENWTNGEPQYFNVA